MKDNKILLAAIKKAEAHGFVMNSHKHYCEIGRDILTGDVVSLGAYQSIIFDQDFAKALWGDEFIHSGVFTEDGDKIIERAYKYHLHQMVIEEEPIKYLEKFI